MGVLCLVYLICALRTNIVFLVIFATLVLAFGFLAGAYWQLAQGNAVLGGKLVVVCQSTHRRYRWKTKGNHLGRRCMYVCHLYGGMVSISTWDVFECWAHVPLGGSFSPRCWRPSISHSRFRSGTSATSSRAQVCARRRRSNTLPRWSPNLHVPRQRERAGHPEGDPRDWNLHQRRTWLMSWDPRSCTPIMIYAWAG